VSDFIESLKNPDVKLLQGVDCVTPDKFEFIRDPLEREAFAIAVNGRKALNVAIKDGFEAMYSVEAAVRSEFIRLGVPRRLYDQIIAWDRSFYAELRVSGVMHPEKALPTIRYD
jgi:hypothetical protein